MQTNLKLQIFASAAQNCAMQMMSNATYIQTELPSLRLPEGMSEQIATLCDSLIATKHDVISEIFELSEVSESSSPSNINERVKMIIQWLWETIQEMNEVAQSLQTAAGADPQFSISCLLVAESASNILNPFNRAAEAADGLPQPQQ
jgi:hypothetical protein